MLVIDYGGEEESIALKESQQCCNVSLGSSSGNIIAPNIHLIAVTI
jgi:hypothetical protein